MTRLIAIMLLAFIAAAMIPHTSSAQESRYSTTEPARPEAEQPDPEQRFQQFIYGVAVFYLFAHAIVCSKLADQKGHDPTTALIVGLIPILNMLMMFYLIGAKDNLLDEKIDKLLARLPAPPTT